MSRDIYELLEKMIDKKVKGADTYINNASRWLIFTDEKKWIFELTKEGTLWYNYYFFERIFKLISLNVGENQHHITKWVENFVQNGVKQTQWGTNQRKNPIEDAIQNGVKETFLVEGTRNRIVEDTIQNGVKRILPESIPDSFGINDAIQNGVKETYHGIRQRISEIEDTIQNGVTNTQPNLLMSELTIEETIQNGIKETNPHFLEILNPMNFEPVTKEMKRMNEVNIVLEKGIKETKYCELHSLMRADHIIRDGIKETWGYEKQPQIRVTEVINEGIKETNWRKVDNHPTYLDNIIRANNCN